MPDYLIAYDIAAPKRLQKIHKRLCEEAIPLQNSTFLYRASPGQFEHLWQELALMSKNEDDLRAYRLPAASLCYEYHPKTRKASTACSPFPKPPAKKQKKRASIEKTNQIQ